MKPNSRFLPRLSAAVLPATLLISSLAANAATFNWDGGHTTSNSWGAADNWEPNGAPTFNNEADLVFNVLARTNNFLGNHRTIRSITYGPDIDDTFQTNYQDFAAGAARNLTMEAASGNASITVQAGATGNISLGTSTGATGGIGTMILADDLDITHNGSGLLLFNRAISGSGFGITKTGTGTVQLNNNNTFSGAINLNEGTLIANTFGSDGQDLNAASAINLAGGTLEIRASVGVSKSYAAVPVNVNSASTLVYNNVNATTFTAQFTGTSAFAVNAPLTVRNISTNTAVVNAFNVTRAITGTGDITVETYQNVSSTADNFSIGRFLLGGDNSGWSGNLTIAKGTVSLGGNAVNAAGTGTITLGTTADTFGAGLTFFPTGLNGSTVTYANDITVTSGGFRAIKGGNTDHNITFDGDIALAGNLALDHTLSTAGRRIHLNGTLSGDGGLTISRAAGNAETAVRLAGVNTYTGPTLVTTGASLALAEGSSLVSNVTLQTGATLGGSGTVGALEIQSGGTLAPGTLYAGTSAGLLSSGDFSLLGLYQAEINGLIAGTDHDQLQVSGGVDVTNGSLSTVFTGSYSLSDMIFILLNDGTDAVTGTFAGLPQGAVVTSYGGFDWQISYSADSSGNTFTGGNDIALMAVPEPSAALLGLLGWAALLRRRR
jgi:autotransporter-associated beta strand protein